MDTERKRRAKAERERREIGRDRVREEKHGKKVRGDQERMERERSRKNE